MLLNYSCPSSPIPYASNTFASAKAVCAGVVTTISGVATLCLEQDITSGRALITGQCATSSCTRGTNDCVGALTVSALVSVNCVGVLVTCDYAIATGTGAIHACGGALAVCGGVVPACGGATSTCTSAKT